MVTALALILFVFGFPYQQVFVPLLAKETLDLGNSGVGWLAASTGVAGQQSIIKERGNQAQGLEAARAASRVAAIQAQSDADRNRAIGRVIEGQAKAASSISVEQAKGAQAAQRAAEKAAHLGIEGDAQRCGELCPAQRQHRQLQEAGDAEEDNIPMYRWMLKVIQSATVSRKDAPLQEAAAQMLTEWINGDEPSPL